MAVMKLESRTATLADEVLAVRAARGDVAAFEALVRRHAGPLLAFCRRVVGNADEAEDRAQEAFMRVYKALDRFDPTRRFSSWLYRIAQNACVDALRARREWTSLDDSVEPAARPSAPLPAELPPGLDDALRALPARQRAVLHLKYALGLDAIEIAERMEMTPGNVRVVLHRAIRTLREQLA